jgi:hypothetical protein
VIVVNTWWSQYFDAPVDYSKSFDERVAKLAEALSDELGGVAVRHDTDMNYNAGQRVSVMLTADGKPTADIAAAKYRITAVISSKGPLWALIPWQKVDGRAWVPVSVLELAGIGDTVLAAMAKIMDAAGLRQVPDEVLGDEVEGRVTELDELPATVRDVLFCEVC